jgi:hypothetical protein
MPIKLTDLIARVPVEVEEKVRRARDQARPVVQDALRAECRLFFRTPEEVQQNRPGAQVPIEIAPGHPVVLEEIVFPDDLERIILLGRYRTFLEQARNGTAGLLRLREELLSRPHAENWVSASSDDLCSVANWAGALLKVLDEYDPLKLVLAVREDFLGVYKYEAGDLFADEFAVNRAKIRLYWGVIGLVSDWLGCTAEDLTTVVLTHELAHAYTQLGADIEGRRWPAESFVNAEVSVKEGLAQYYTHRVLHRLERRYGGALNIFKMMLPRQPEPYRAHEMWIRESSPEAIRRAMIEMRRWKEGKLVDFNRRLALAQQELGPKS